MDDPTVRWPSRIAGSPIGRFLYRWLNVSPRLLVKFAWRDETELTDEVHRHYTKPYRSPGTRTPQWVLARELLGSGEWYESLWQRRDRITSMPTLVLWGLADPTFGERYLERWERVLVDARIVRLDNVGHFVPDEAATTVAPEIATFLNE